MHWYAAMNYGWMESSWTWRCVSHQHKKRRALSPRHMRIMSVGNNGGEMQGEGWSFLLWQASKQPAGWIAVIGVKCPQLAVHWQSCAARSSILSLRRSCRRGGRRRGAGTGVRLSRLTHVALTLAAVWRMKRRLPYKIDCHIIIGSTCWAGGGDMAADGGKGEASFQRCPLMGFSLCECVCVLSLLLMRERAFIIIGHYHG